MAVSHTASTKPRTGGPTGGPNSIVEFVRRRWLIILVLVAILIYPFVDGFQDNTTRITTLVNAGIFVLMALGLNIVVGYAGLLDLGYVAFFTLGAYSYAIANFGNIHVVGNSLAYVTPGNPQHIGGTSVHLALWPLLLGGMVIAAVFG